PALTRPLLDIEQLVRRVMETRDFSLRAPKSTDDEIGQLADAVNDMLAEIGRRAEALEESHRSLEHEVAERERAEAELRRLNDELERRVAERTAQLEAANKELEGFSYSVSHDLRAPLRAVVGFAELLWSDHGAQLDAEAKRKLDIIRAETARMGTLIDDLLAFSRLGRKSLQPAERAMAEVATTGFEPLRDEPWRDRVTLTMGRLPRAVADRALLEQVWVNLLSNAIKFSAKQEQPVVEVGGITEEREH